MSLFYIVGNWVERVTKGARVIDTDHGYIHAGKAFEVADTAVGSSSTSKRYSFEPTSTGGSEKYIHLRPAYLAIPKGVATFEIWEDSTKDSTGTVITAYNRNRISSNTSEFSLRKNDLSTAPTSTGTYKKVHSKRINGGTGPANTGAGGQAGDPLEWVLKRNTKYVFAVNTTEAYGINFFWYEEDDA